MVFHGFTVPQHSGLETLASGFSSRSSRAWKSYLGSCSCSCPPPGYLSPLSPQHAVARMLIPNKTPAVELNPITLIICFFLLCPLTQACFWNAQAHNHWFIWCVPKCKIKIKIQKKVFTDLAWVISNQLIICLATAVT